MLHTYFIQLGYLAVWGTVLAGGVILLRRGYANGAMPVLFGTGVLVLLQILTLCMMLLQARGLIAGLAAARIYQILWVPQLAGGFLFAFGFLHLARTTKREGPDDPA
jgi:hypothetical protein